MGKKLLVLLLIATISFGGCYTMTHTVGTGGKGAGVETEKQWYILFGLVPLNKVDSKSMAKGANDYTITTQMTFVDWLISCITGIVTIQSMSVEVRR